MPELKKREFTLTKTFKFEAAHRIPNHMKCGNLHGHTFKLTIGLTGEIQENGMVYDFNDLSLIVRPIIEDFDHSNLNDRFAIPTAELVTYTIWKHLDSNLPGYINYLSVSLQEGEGGTATYEHHRSLYA